MDTNPPSDPQPHPSGARDPLPAHDHTCGCDHDHEHSHPTTPGAEAAPHDHGHGPDCAHDHHHAHVAVLDQRFFHWAGCALLLFWGAVMLYYFASGRITHYLTGTGSFRLQCLLTGLALCVLAVFNLLVRKVGPTRGQHDTSADTPGSAAPDHGGDCCGHDHGHSHGGDGSWIARITAFLILAVPLATAAVYSPDRYSDEFFKNKVNAIATTSTAALGGGGIDLNQRAEKAKPLPGSEAAAAPKNSNAFTVEELERLSGGRTPDGHINLQLVELFYMPAQTRDVQEVVAQETVETVGQAIKDKSDPTKLRLFRLMMTCCAADARPVSMPVEFEGAPPEWREMGWYRVVGKVEYRDIDGTPTTVLKATALEPTKPPRQQMMF